MNEVQWVWDWYILGENECGHCERRGENEHVSETSDDQLDSLLYI